MKCIIDKVLEKAHQKNKRLEVIARYIRLKYKIKMDLSTLRMRIQAFKNYPPYEIA